mmetsp:Transcript_59603/g.164753  ORF Transcript_59603/g.164753 Transcript_59603/m.164753 type:complete len:233 (+) Transcript_59603:247-945(+)
MRTGMAAVLCRSRAHSNGRLEGQWAAAIGARPGAPPQRREGLQHELNAVDVLLLLHVQVQQDHESISQARHREEDSSAHQAHHRRAAAEHQGNAKGLPGLHPSLGPVPAPKHADAVHGQHGQGDKASASAQQQTDEEPHIPLADASTHPEAMVVQAQHATATETAMAAAVRPPKPALAAPLLLPAGAARQSALADALRVVELIHRAGVFGVRLRSPRVHQMAQQAHQDCHGS